MFGATFNVYSGELDESIYPRCPPLPPPPQRFRSRFASKVRIDTWLQRSGCRKTMGLPCDSLLLRPLSFLKKHSRLAPVFLDPQKMSIKVEKEKVERAAREKYEEIERRERLGFNGPKAKVDQGRRDFLEENALKVIQTPGKRSIRCYIDEEGRHRVDLSQGPYVLRHGFGQVPLYIQRRKQQLYCEDLALKREIQAAQDQFQPNARQIEEEQKNNLIIGLKQRLELLTKDFLRLPSYPSDQLDRTKAELEDLMRQIENDIRLLQSTDELLVANENNYTQSHYI